MQKPRLIDHGDGKPLMREVKTLGLLLVANAAARDFGRKVNPPLAFMFPKASLVRRWECHQLSLVPADRARALLVTLARQ